MYRLTAALTALALPIFAGGCIERQATSDDAQADPIDASVHDTALSEFEPQFREPSTTRPQTSLGRALLCDLSEAEALHASVRAVACTPDDTRTTVAGLMEGWAAGLFGSGDPLTQDRTGQQVSRGCDAWRCLAEAPSCAEAQRCHSGPPADPEPAFIEECEPGSEFCVNNGIVSCDRGMQLILDCSVIGLTCIYDEPREGVACGSPDCTTRLAVDEMTCDGNQLMACDGALTIDCENQRPGSRCQPLAIAGQAPINFCGPDAGFSGAGLYAVPVSCGDDGVITFTTLTIDQYRFDCRAAGYSGCNRRGCAE